MPHKLKPFFILEIEHYINALNDKNLQKAWHHLERAHIIGQLYPLQHTYVHLKMLLFGFKIKSMREILGQIPRLIFGGIKSFVGLVPFGNTGGANVPPLKSIPIEKSVLEIFKKAGISA